MFSGGTGGVSFCRVLGRTIEGNQNFGLEKPLGAQSLHLVNLEDNVESNADNGGLACEDPRGTSRVVSMLF